MTNRPLTKKEWMAFLEKACDEFDWENAGKREWQGLTDDEKRSLVEWAHPDIIEAIELKLRERNT